MKLKFVIFDLDGTLLPMRHEDFIDAYASTMKDFMQQHFGYCPKKLEKAICLRT